MDETELNNILGSRPEHTEGIFEDKQEQSTNIQPDNNLTCPECDFVAKNKLALSGHLSKHYGKGYKNKSNATATKDNSVLPENIAFLKSSCLKPFGAKGAENIVQGMMEAPEDLSLLQSLLAANDNSKNIPYILSRYANYIGKPVPNSTSAPAPTDVSAIDDILSRKRKEADLKLLDSYIGGGSSNTNKNDTTDLFLKMYMQTMQNMQNTNVQKPNPELESLKTKMLKVQEHNKKLEDLLIRQKQEAELASMKEEIKHTKESYEGQLSGLASAMKEFITDQQHWKNMFDQERQYTKQLQDLK